jgi:hypothetical protein
MAMEIEAGAWKYLGDEDDVDGELPPFEHTPLHDIESLLWMAVWTLDNRYLDSSRQCDWQVSHFWSVFESWASKYVFLQRPEILRWLKPGLQQFPQLSDVVKPMSRLAKCIYDAHTKLQRSRFAFDRSVYADHEVPREVVRCMVALFEELDKSVTLHPEPPE